MSETSSVSNNKMSTAQLRKIKKPIIERRRRGRINESLNQLKALVLEALHKDESRYSKMEKADILEMTVKHLKAVQKQQAAMTNSMAMTTGQDLFTKYRSGFNECAVEINSYLGQMEGLTPEVQGRLMQHLDGVSKTTVSRATLVPNATPLTSLPGGNSPFVVSATQLGVSQPLSVSVPVSLMSPAATVAPSTTTSNSTVNLNSAIPLYISPRATSSPITMSPCSSRSSTPCSAHSPLAGDEVPRGFPDVHSPSQAFVHYQMAAPEVTRTSPIVIQPARELKPTAGPVWRPW